MCKKIIYSLCTLIIGICIYLLSSYGLLTKSDYISSFIRNYVPDILWAISFYTLSTVFSKALSKYYIILTALYVILVGIFFEYLQFTGVAMGTFDVFDILVYIISTIIASLTEKYYWREKNEEKNS